MGKGIELIFEDSRGVFIPQNFAQEINLDKIQGIEQIDIDILLKGPEDNELYWDSWNRVLDEAYYIDENQKKWSFYQDGDLFSFCPELMTGEEKNVFFGGDLDEDLEDYLDNKNTFNQEIQF